MRVYLGAFGAKEAHELRGPADLVQAGGGDILWLHGALDSPAEIARWAAPIGMAALRGATIKRWE